MNNQWGGFKALRERWLDHLGSTTRRSVLLCDEAQEMSPMVLNELIPLGSRIRTRLAIEPASREELIAGLEHLLEKPPAMRAS